ncbi:hypothetical protein EVAR_36441_1 [Eumeta japonica]|uniref:Uncharacterized protein n=1 Tax=Eumeta variegata TaxID=151549 RepID=A0A4C1VSC6_EUMVA|nr:hypothetical protein EVAR_36441_1 [Eumeta japonica]
MGDSQMIHRTCVRVSSAEDEARDKLDGDLPTKNPFVRLLVSIGGGDHLQSDGSHAHSPLKNVIKNNMIRNQYVQTSIEATSRYAVRTLSLIKPTAVYNFRSVIDLSISQTGEC